MKPITRKNKDIRGRKIVSYTATIGTISADGAAPGLAIASCERKVLEALERLEQGPKVGTFRGHNYFVAPTSDGWMYWLDTFSNTYTSCQMSGTRDDAMHSALSHLASNLWDFDCPDDRAFIEPLPITMHADLTQRFAWYRAMKTFTDLGYTDQQARDLIDQGTTYKNGAYSSPSDADGSIIMEHHRNKS